MQKGKQTVIWPQFLRKIRELTVISRNRKDQFVGKKRFSLRSRVLKLCADFFQLVLSASLVYHIAQKFLIGAKSARNRIWLVHGLNIQKRRINSTIKFIKNTEHNRASTTIVCLHWKFLCNMSNSLRCRRGEERTELFTNSEKIRESPFLNAYQNRLKRRIILPDRRITWAFLAFRNVLRNFQKQTTKSECSRFFHFVILRLLFTHSKQLRVASLWREFNVSAKSREGGGAEILGQNVFYPFHWRILTFCGTKSKTDCLNHHHHLINNLNHHHRHA